MLREFEAELQKGDNPGAWTCVVMDDAAELFRTGGLVKIRGTIDGAPFTSALMAQGDGTHRLPVRRRFERRSARRRATPSTSESASGPVSWPTAPALSRRVRRGTTTLVRASRTRFRPATRAFGGIDTVSCAATRICSGHKADGETAVKRRSDRWR